MNEAMKKLVALFYMIPALVLAEQDDTNLWKTWLKQQMPYSLPVVAHVGRGCGVSTDEVHTQAGAILYASGIKPKIPPIGEALVIDDEAFLVVEVHCGSKSASSGRYIFSVQTELVRRVLVDEQQHMARVWPAMRHSRFGVASSAEILTEVSESVGAFVSDFKDANFDEGDDR